MNFEQLKEKFPEATKKTWHQHPNGKGWVENTASVAETAFVGENAVVSGNALVSGDAWVRGNAWVFGNAQVSGDARVRGDAQVSQRSDCIWMSCSSLCLLLIDLIVGNHAFDQMIGFINIWPPT